MDKKTTTKTFKDFNEQIALLESRGLIFDNKKSKEKFKQHLRLFNYQNFVNGYNDFFMVNNDRSTNAYKKTSNSEHIISLFNFDRNISSIVLPVVLSIERAFSTAICYHILFNHKDLDQKINEGKILDLKKSTFLKIFPNLPNDEIDSFKENILGYCSNKVISRKYSSKNDIPLWTLCVYWSFGNANSIYRKLNDETKFKIFKFMTHNKARNKNSVKSFESCMIMLNDIRNLLCHCNVIYKFKYTKNASSINSFINEFISKQKCRNIRLSEAIKIICFLSPQKTEIDTAILKQINILSKKIDKETFDSISIYIRSKKLLDKNQK